MAMMQQDFTFDRQELENLILRLGEIYEIRIHRRNVSTVLMVGCTIIGGIVGGRVGGKIGTAVGTAIGAGAGAGAAALMALSEVWHVVKTKLEELAFILYNDLRANGISSYLEAIEFITAVTARRESLVRNLISFIAVKLSCYVVSTLGAEMPTPAIGH